VAQVIILDKISCESFAELTFKFIESELSDYDIDVVSVKVSEHSSNAAIYLGD